jgi:hypothetical protein
MSASIFLNLSWTIDWKQRTRNLYVADEISVKAGYELSTCQDQMAGVGYKE